jgi:hypothetical protein
VPGLQTFAGILAGHKHVEGMCLRCFEERVVVRRVRLKNRAIANVCRKKMGIDDYETRP